MLDNYFKNIFVINLDSSKNRWTIIQSTFNNNNIKNYKRFPAVVYKNGANFLYREMGCAYSHYSLIQMAKDNNWDNILIFEDDAEILPSFQQKLPHIIDFLKNNEWELFYFGGSHRGEKQPINQNIRKVFGCYTTHAYAINKSVYDLILPFKKDEANYKRSIDCIDNILVDYIQKRGKSFCTNPNTISQRDGMSEIRKQVENYKWIRES